MNQPAIQDLGSSACSSSGRTQWGESSEEFEAAFGGGLPAPAMSGVGLVQELVDAVQAGDHTFQKLADRNRPEPAVPAVAAVHVYPGTGHAFALDHNALGTHDADAQREAWVRTLEFLRKHLG